MSPKAKRRASAHLREKYHVSARRRCRLLGLEQSTHYYKAKPRRDEAELRAKMIEFTQRKTRYGLPRVVWYLREVEGMVDNHKRISRVYRELGLQINRRRGGKKKRSGLRLILEKPTKPLELWAMDFVSDSFNTGRKFRTLTITDLFTHETPALEVDVSLTGIRVGQVLDRLKLSHGLPKAIICDNGSEFTCRAMDQWAFANKVELKFIQPGKPNQNAYCESFNARLRDECLNANWFSNLTEAREIIESWRKEFNEERPHSSLNNKTPKMFANEYYKSVAA